MSRKKGINLYDFDHTIYRGDVSMQFIFYCFLNDPGLWGYIPGMCWAFLNFVFGTWGRKRVKEQAFAFLKDVDGIDKLIETFWEKSSHNIEAWYISQRKHSDVIISASPEFLLAGITAKLGVAKLIATKMDKHSGEIIGANCRGKEKLNRLRRYDSSILIDACYSDSLTDLPILSLAECPYIVAKHKPVPLADFTPARIKQTFADLAFIRFLVVGVVNAFLGIIFSYAWSFVFSSALVAFIIGYALSLTVSYPLNSVVTFREFSFSLKRFITFCASYIPNFLVQLICVHLLANYIGVYRLFAYILAVVIAVPVTFILLSRYTFTSGASS